MPHKRSGSMDEESPIPPDFDHAFAPASDSTGLSVSPLGPVANFYAPSHAFCISNHADVSWGPRDNAQSNDRPADDPFHDDYEAPLDPLRTPSIPIDRPDCPRLRIVTPVAVDNQHQGTKRTGTNDGRQNVASKDCIVDVTSIPSGSTTATGSGSPPSASKSKGFPDPPRPNPGSRRITGTSTTSATSNSASTPKRKVRWLQRGRSYERRPSRPVPLSPSTPLRLPRRLSRLPSFFTRERLYLPRHLQRRDIAMLVTLILLATCFLGIGIFAAVRPKLVCKSSFLENAVNAFLPSLLIGAPYTLLVVGVGVCEWGRRWIKGRYTPLLYAGVAVLGRVGMGALIGNLDWTLLAC